MAKQIAVLSTCFFCNTVFAQGNIDRTSKCSMNVTGGSINNSNIYCNYNEPKTENSTGNIPPSEGDDLHQEKWKSEGFNRKTISTIPVYIYPGMQHDRDGQIAEGLKRILSSKLNFSDKYHAALFLRVVDANVYYVSPLDAEDEPKGYAGFQVDLKWAGGASLPPVVASAQTNSIAGNLPRNEALQVNAMNLAISQACRKIISMAGDNPKGC